MYFELTAPDRLSMEMAYWDAQIVGLDPQAMSSLLVDKWIAVRGLSGETGNIRGGL